MEDATIAAAGGTAAAEAQAQAHAQQAARKQQSLRVTLSEVPSLNGSNAHQTAAAVFDGAAAASAEAAALARSKQSFRGTLSQAPSLKVHDAEAAPAPAAGRGEAAVGAADLRTEEENQVLSPSLRSLICRSFQVFLERYSMLCPPVAPASSVAGPDDVNMPAKEILDDSKPPHLNLLHHTSKKMKHAADASWLYSTLQSTLSEMEKSGTYSLLANLILEHDIAAKRVPESLEHVKSLNAEMHSLRQQMQVEDLAHKQAVVNWSKSLVQIKQAIKELKKQNKLTAQYRADMAIAEADCKRRLREERLKLLRDEISQLENQIEVEKRVNVVCVDFLKKQNLMLMEEAINLATGHENDVQYMDLMLNKLRDQKVEKEKLLSELEPRYNAEMAERAAQEADSQKEQTLDLEELGRFETETRAVIKIQKVWRGFKVRLQHSQELKKIAKKRKELKKKKKGQGKKKKKDVKK